MKGLKTNLSFCAVGVLAMGLLLLTGCGKDNFQAGKDYFRSGQHTQAITLFSEAIALDPNHQEAYFFRGAAFSATGNSTKLSQITQRR